MINKIMNFIFGKSDHDHIYKNVGTLKKMRCSCGQEILVATD